MCLVNVQPAVDSISHDLLLVILITNKSDIIVFPLNIDVVLLLKIMKNNGLMIQMMMTALLGSVTTDGVVLCESVRRTCVGDLPLIVKQERSYHFVVRRRSALFSLFLQR